MFFILLLTGCSNQAVTDSPFEVVQYSKELYNKILADEEVDIPAFCEIVTTDYLYDECIDHYESYLEYTENLPYAYYQASETVEITEGTLYTLTEFEETFDQMTVYGLEDKNVVEENGDEVFIYVTDCIHTSTDEDTIGETMTHTDYIILIKHNESYYLFFKQIVE